MPSSLDLTQNKGIYALFKGDSGAGKTVGALSFPNVYHFDIDKKMPAIAQKHFPKKDITYDRFEDVYDIERRCDELMDNCPYETVVFDSFTTLIDLAFQTMRKQEGLNIMNQMRKAKGKVELMPIHFYSNETAFATDWFLPAIKKLWERPGFPNHVILLAHVTTVESDPDLKTKIKTVTRSIVSRGKKVGVTVPTGFDEMYHFCLQDPDLGVEGQRSKHICITEGLGVDSAKTAFKFPPVIDFTNGSLFDILKKYDSNFLGPQKGMDM